VVKIAIFAIFALSLELLVGVGGLVSLGHAAFLGIGAYVTVLATGDGDARSMLWLAPLAMAYAAAYALFVGALSLRTKGVYFIMVTLAFAQMAYFVFHDTKLAGGSDGIFLYAKPVLDMAGRTLLNLDDKRHLYYAVVAALAMTYALLALIQASRFGHALAGIRVNEQRMRAAGFSTYGYKLAAFVIAGALAGLAGFLLAVKDGAVNPELLSWHESGAVLLMLILGGIGSLRGAVIGAVAFTLLKELFQSEALLGPLAGHWQMTLGFTIIAFVAWLPKGLVGLGARVRGAGRG
jgi:branched-chain amino acid transport system permease protein